MRLLNAVPGCPPDLGSGMIAGLKLLGWPVTATPAGRFRRYLGMSASRSIGGGGLTLVALAMIHALAVRPVQAESLADTLVHVYQTNAVLNAQRAQLRVTDENVPQALAGYRPQLSVGLSAGINPVKNTLPDGSTQSATLRPWMAGVTLTQPLFNGFRTANSVRQAESQVRSGREALRNIEQTLFVNAVTAYMNVVADQALVEAQRANAAFLRETLNATHKRLEAGDVTPTDVAQAEARLNRGLADLNAAEVALAVDQATYTQVVGRPPSHLTMAEPADRWLPHTREDAISLARRENPAVVAAAYDVDTAEAAIRIAQSSLLPTLSVQGAASRSVNTDVSLTTTSTDQASILGLATIPLYDGGLAASQVRQAKEALAQSRNVLDQARAQNEAAVVTAWVQNDGAKTAIRAGEAEVHAATLALEGVRKEALAGQRTTLDILNAQQDLVAARSRLIQAQRDRVIASYSLLSAIGRLDHKRLELPTPEYEPGTHYHQVRDAWHGLRTPSGQ